MSNKQSGCGSSLWVYLLWSVCASDVRNMWVWVTVGVAAPCWCLLARWKALRDACVCLMSEMGVATLWVCLWWSVGASDVVGVSYCGRCSPLLVFTGI